MNGFLRELQLQRWDDHRYYHHSRINQSLHLVSALSFLCTYVLLFSDPVAAALIGWGVAMTSRQIGHFFFEPKTYDVENQATHEYKERIKVGYNLRRKVVLTVVWALAPIVLVLEPTLFGTVDEANTPMELVRQIAIAWILIGAGALVFRTVQLFFIRDVQTGLVWITKILTDPFHDIKLYYKAPLYLMRGQFVAPLSQEHDHARQRTP